MLKKRFAVLSALASAVLLVCAPARAQEQLSVDAAESGRLWFVELSGAPVADGNSLKAVQAEKAGFRRNAAAAGLRYSERRSFDTLFNGLVVEIDLAERGRLQSLAGVKAIYPVEQIAGPTPDQREESVVDMQNALALTGARVAQDTLGLRGRGVKVGIIDTGIDIDHPAFGGGGVPGGTAFPSARVVAGHDFVGDAFGTSGPPVPDANPDDCGGHGSHVAGIVGGNGGGVVGVAPGVQFGAYRVFGCAGSTSADIIVAALERAYADGMHIVNMSLGASRQWPQYPTAQASNRLVNKGVVVVASIGNNGPGGSQPDALFAAGAPGVGDKVIGVASFDNGQLSFRVNGTPYGYNVATGAPLPPTSGSLSLARTGTPSSVNDGCAALPAGSLVGQAVLIRRGTCAFSLKALNAQNAGAAAVVLYNNAAGALNPTVVGTPPVTIPVVAITADQGVALNNLIAAGPTSLQWTAEAVGYPYGTGGLISGFSSFGPSAELQLKPNIGAPGGGISSAYPLEAGGRAVLSGTSMSSPHVAGGVALILEARPKLKAQGMMARLQNVADPKNWSGNPGLGLLDFSFRQGAGMMDIVGAIQASTVVEPSQLALGESEAGAQTRTLTVRNEGSSAVKYLISHAPALTSGPNLMAQLGVSPPASYNTTGSFNAPATASFSAASISVAPGASASFDVTLSAHTGAPSRSLYGGYVVLTPEGGGEALRVPYVGFVGDYQSTPVLSAGASGFPWLAKRAGTSYQNQNASGASYSMVNGDMPYVLLHLDHHARRVRMEVEDADTGKSWHRINDEEFVGRNSSPNGFFPYAWDGTSFTGKGKGDRQQYLVPNGRYRIKLSVLKPLGDESNPTHWQVWSSNVVTLARP